MLNHQTERGIVVVDTQGNKMKTLRITKKHSYGDSVYGDVLSHCKKPETKESRYTNVHETSHYISSEIRQTQKPGNNAFYILDGEAVVIEEPPITIKDVAEYVPPKLQGLRYKTYLVDQRRHWNEQPLYILDEWNAYVLGGLCAIDDFQNKRKLEKTDALAGMFEFMIYSTALAMCVQDKCPEYWEKNKQFRDFIQYRMDTSSMIFAIGREVPQFTSLSSDQLYKTWHNSDEGKEFQNFIDKYFTNQEPIRLGFDYL